MAGDWIKMRAALCTNPKVLLIAEIIGTSTEVGKRLSTGFTTGFSGELDSIVTRDVTRDVTLASLLRVWCATNEHTDDGVWHNSTLRTLDSAAGVPGFGAAMAKAGWAIYDEEAGTVTLPKFLENNAPAKNGARSSGAERQARYRKKRHELACSDTLRDALCDASRDPDSDASRNVTVTSQSDTREEKRREEERPTPTRVRANGTAHKFPPGFETLWEASPKKIGKLAAAKAFAKIKPDNDLLNWMIKAIEAQKSSEMWRKDGGQFIPHLATWLNQGRWLDKNYEPISPQRGLVL